MTIEEEFRQYTERIEAMGLSAPLMVAKSKFQYQFFTSQADIVIGGGSAGGGKTYALLMEAARNHLNPRFSAVIFRRLLPEILNPGGLWDEAVGLYGASVGGESIEKPPTCYFPHPGNPKERGAKVTFRSLQYEKDVNQHHGGQYPLICFDELAHFTEKQFWYLLSRNRTTIGVKPYMRCTTNPESMGWLKDLISWWIYPDDHPDPMKAGFPIPERQGVIRYFVREGGTLYFANTREELILMFPELFPPNDVIKPKDKIKSLTFIAGSVRENLELLKHDPGYIGSLMALPEADRLRLLDGCWKHKEGEDQLFPWASLEDLFTNDFISDNVGFHDRFITADVALEGADTFVVMVWYGWVVKEIMMYEKTNSTMVLQILRETASRHSVMGRNIAYDRDGVGDYISGFLKSSFGFRGNAQPMEVTDPAIMQGVRQSGLKSSLKPEYDNLRAQVYYEAGAAVESAEVYVEHANEFMMKRLKEELQATRKATPSSRGKLRVIPKDRVKETIRRSPDLADAFVMRWVFKYRKVRRAASSAVG